MVPNSTKMWKNMKGLILAGGESSRLGADKSLLELNGLPQREYLFTLLSSFCTNVFLSCKDVAKIPPQFNPIPDKYQYNSPLNGIMTSLETDAESPWLTVPVDMPNINETVLKFLIAERSAQQIATCFYDSDGKLPEPLLTIWEPAALPFLQLFYRSGRKSPRDFLINHDVKIVRPPFPGLHENINTPSDLKMFRERHS